MLIYSLTEKQWQDLERAHLRCLHHLRQVLPDSQNVALWLRRSRLWKHQEKVRYVYNLNLLLTVIFSWIISIVAHLSRLRFSRMFLRTTQRRLWRSRPTLTWTCRSPVFILADTAPWWRRLLRRSPTMKARRNQLEWTSKFSWQATFLAPWRYGNNAETKESMRIDVNISLFVSIHRYLIIFLKFMSSVVPTIDYDNTISA